MVAASVEYIAANSAERHATAGAPSTFDSPLDDAHIDSLGGGSADGCDIDEWDHFAVNGIILQENGIIPADVATRPGRPDIRMRGSLLVIFDPGATTVRGLCAELRGILRTEVGVTRF